MKNVIIESGKCPGKFIVFGINYNVGILMELCIKKIYDCRKYIFEKEIYFQMYVDMKEVAIWTIEQRGAIEYKCVQGKGAKTIGG